LAKRELPIVEIALAVGFASEHMTTHFRRVVERRRGASETTPDR